MPQVVRSIEIQAAPSKVWRWFATQEALRRWISSNIEIDLLVGGAYAFSAPMIRHGSAVLSLNWSQREA